MKLAKQHGIKVMLDGQGADEYLAGYSPFQMLIASQMRRLKVIRALKELSGCAKKRHLGLRGAARLALSSLRAALAEEQTVYASEYQNNSSKLGFNNAAPFALEKFHGSRLKEHLYHMMFARPLPALLHYGDRMSMAFSIENRVPFLDHRLVEFVYSLDDEDIFFSGTTKYILRKSLEGILPSAIAEQRVKQQFRGREITKWLTGPLGYLAEARFDFDRLRILDPHRVETLLRRFKGGDVRQANMVWKLAVLNYWAARQ
jgi:asparagine synthase (glutamine-hydrolysing)